MIPDSIPYLDAATVVGATPMPRLIAALRDAFATGAHVAPPRLSSAMGRDASLLVMPAWRPDGAVGVKTVTVDPKRRPSIRSDYLLTHPASERPLAVIDGTMLTRRRTAAASVLAATCVARPDAQCLLLLGTGALIAPLLEAYASTFPLRRVLIWGRSRVKAEAAAAHARGLGYPAERVDSVADGLTTADIVSAATLATRPLIKGSLLRAGTHVDLVGAFRPDMCEADGEAFARSRVFVDTFEGTLDEAGDLLQAIDGGHFRPDAIEADLAALASGRHAGRGGDTRAITLFKSVGTAIEDLAAAQLVYDAWSAS